VRRRDASMHREEVPVEGSAVLQNGPRAARPAESRRSGSARVSGPVVTAAPSVGFIAAVISVLIFHQGMWAALHALALPGLAMPPLTPLTQFRPGALPASSTSASGADCMKQSSACYYAADRSAPSDSGG
jgi:hypothetical protein